MFTISDSATITAPEPETEPREEPCHVQQQPDAEDTVPCSGDEAMLNELLRVIGFDIPVPSLPEDYSTQIRIKPKNPYTDLNIDFSDNVSASPGRWEQTNDQQSVSLSSSDFVASGGTGYVDLGQLLNLVETDIIKSADWIGTVYDANLVAMSIKPSIKIDDNNRLPLEQPVNAELLVTIAEEEKVFDLTVSPREGWAENPYQSSMIVQPEGCEAQPSRYEIKVPPCYPNSKLFPDIIIPFPYPEFVKPVDAEDIYCVCGNNKLQARYPKSRQEADISNVCKGGPCDQYREPDCVPNDRKEGDEYC